MTIAEVISARPTADDPNVWDVELRFHAPGYAEHVTVTCDMSGADAAWHGEPAQAVPWDAPGDGGGVG